MMEKEGRENFWKKVTNIEDPHGNPLWLKLPNI